MKSGEATPIADSQKTENLIEQNQRIAETVRRDEPPDGSLASIVRNSTWIACNEVTDKLAKKSGDAIGWTMLIEGMGWFGRAGKEMSFGPTTRARARLSVEAYLRGEPFEKRDDERSWRGDCGSLISMA
jgi:hypothetical protein